MAVIKPVPEPFMGLMGFPHFANFDDIAFPTPVIISTLPKLLKKKRDSFNYSQFTFGGIFVYIYLSINLKRGCLLYRLRLRKCRNCELSDLGKMLRLIY